MRRPLSVVGTDQEALTALLSLHACPDPRILDVTHNRGRMWKGLPYRPHRSDRDPVLHDEGFTDTVADFRALPFEDASFDVIVFDPPHITDQSNTRTEYRERYGTSGNDIHGDSIAFLFEPFLREATRVLMPGRGLLLAKLCDSIHSAAYQWLHVDLIAAAREATMTPCDLMLRVSWSRGGLIDPRWQRVCHVRSVHTYWLAIRNGPDCTSPTAPQADTKPKTAPMFSEVVA